MNNQSIQPVRLFVDHENNERYSNRFSMHTVGDGITFFDNKTQSFLEPDAWGQICLSGMVDGLTVEEIVEEIALHSDTSVRKVKSEINRFVTELDNVDISSPFSLDNRQAFVRAKTKANLPCCCAGVRQCNGSSVTIGFDSKELRDAFQAITFDSLQMTKDNVCDIYLSKNDHGYKVSTPDDVVDSYCTLEQSILIAYCKSDDVLAKRMDSLLFIAHAGAVTKSGVTALLPGPGSSGKSTLVASLGSSGYNIVHDDIVPVLENGSLISLGSNVKLRERSWSVIKALYPSISNLPVLEATDGTLVKLTQPIKPYGDVIDSGECQLIIVPEFDPNSTAKLTQISPLEALYTLIESESLLKKPAECPILDDICSWVGGRHCFTARYPDMNCGLKLVEEAYSLVIHP